MELDVEGIATNFFQLASEQRLNILIILNQEKINISNMAKKLSVGEPPPRVEPRDSGG